MRALLNLVPFGVVLSMALLAAPVTANDDAGEAHEPIVISGNQALLIPDAISGNGVRSGTGQAIDPYVISDWEFQLGAGETAIDIQNVDAHLHLLNLQISGDIASSVGIKVTNSKNVTIESVTIESVFKGIQVRNSEAAIRTVTIQDVHANYTRNDAHLAPYAIDIGQSLGTPPGTKVGAVVMEDIAIERAWKGIGTSAHDIALSDVHLRDVPGIGVSLFGPELAISASGIYATGSCPLAGGEKNVIAALSASSDCGFGVMVNANELLLSQVSLAGWGVGLEASARWGSFSDVVAQGNHLGGRFAVMDGQVVNATYSHNGIGLVLSAHEEGVLSAVRLEGSEIANNGRGISVAQSGAANPTPIAADQAGRNIVVTGSDLVGNMEHSLYVDTRRVPEGWPSDYMLDARGNYWGASGPSSSGSNSVAGPVDVGDASRRPFVGGAHEGSARQHAPLTGVAGVLVAVAFAHVASRRTRYR